MEGDETSPEEIVRRAVAPRLDSLDDTFLATLQMYIDGAEGQGKADIAGGAQPLLRWGTDPGV